MKIENKEQAILGLHAGAKNMRAYNHLTKNAQQAWAELCQV